MRDKKPDCPSCHNNINVVRFTTFFRCAFCGEIIKGIAGQIELTQFIDK